jgi:hypothetical protein
MSVQKKTGCPICPVSGLIFKALFTGGSEIRVSEFWGYDILATTPAEPPPTPVIATPYNMEKEAAP